MILGEEMLVGPLVAEVGNALGFPCDESGAESRGKIREAVELVMSQVEPEPGKIKADSLNRVLNGLYLRCIHRYKGVLNDIEDEIARTLGKKVRKHPVFVPKSKNLPPKGKTYVIKPFLPPEQ